MEQASVNFENLRSITGGDPVFEAELFKHFIDGVTTGLTGLNTALRTEDESNWRQHAHALKGLCYNLGAEQLGQLCAQAQQDYRATADEKQAILLKMDTEFLCVRQQLDEAHKL